MVFDFKNTPNTQKSRLALLIALFVVFSLYSQESKAQRTALGTKIVSADVHCSISSFGGELMYGQYIIPGYWFGAVAFTNRAEKDKASGEKCDYPRLQGIGGYMQRVYGNRERFLNIYAGGDVFIGMEKFDMFKTLSESTRNSRLTNEDGSKKNDTVFIYGLSIRAEIEFFITSSVALTAKARMPICFNTNTSFMVGGEFGLGARFNF